MSTSLITLFICGFTILPVKSQETIWSNPLDDTSGSKVAWEIIGTDIGFWSSDSNCPLNKHCWSICGQDANSENAYIYALNSISTIGYTDIYFEFDIRPRSLGSASEYCSFLYNIDRSADTNWHEFYRNDQGEVELINQTAILNDTTYDNIGIGIKLLAMEGNGDCCWTSNVKIRGTPS